jgi:hypothetical protein
VVPCGLVERCEQRSASGVGGGVHGGRIEKERGELPLARPRHNCFSSTTTSIATTHTIRYHAFVRGS